MKQTFKKESDFSFLLRQAGKHKYKLITSAVLSILSMVLSIVPYVLMYNMIMELFKESLDYERIKNLAIITAVFAVIRLILFVSSGIFSHVAAFNILYEIRMNLIKHISSMNMGFFKKNTTGSLKRIINEDIEKLENFIAHQIPDMAAAIAAPLVFLGFMIYLNYKLALVLFIPVLIGIFSQSWMFKSYGKRMEKYHKLLQKLNSTIMEYISAMNVMKAFNLSAKSFKTYKDTTKEYADYWVEITHDTVPYYSLFLTLIDSGLLFIIPIGGIMLLNNSINIATYILFILLCSNFLSSFKAILEFGGNFAMLLKGAGKIKDIMNSPVQSDTALDLGKPVQGDIQYSNVSFRYENKFVIKDFSLKIRQGSTIALVGPSGSGKTTVGQLLGRFWDVNEGSISIGGTDIREIPYKTLMNNVSFVFQDVFMLHDSIYENIRMGKESTEKEVFLAAKKAQIHDFIMSLPKGYQTMLGEGGIKLSGGEKQRISIARAILKNSPVIVLDEVTSYSDIENESKIQQALKELLKNKTAVIIAHRLYTIKNSDLIVVMDEGRISETGTHTQLMQKNGTYKHMWNLYYADTLEKEVC